ncbi:MAG TPA: glycosyltransferase [Jatrophihabitans sp.]
MTRIAQVANFVAPHSGGIRTVLGNLAEGYAARGVEVVQIVPGRRHSTQATRWGTAIAIPGILIPKTGYRVITPQSVREALERVAPDHLEVHDRATLRGLGTWARYRSVSACVISHERLDRLLEQWTGRPTLSRGLADRSNRALADRFETVVCTTAWAAEEFARIGVTNTVLAPLGVDTDTFTPDRADPRARAEFAWPEERLLVLVSRLSPEKRPQLALDTAAELVARGVRVRLVVAGDGPLRSSLEHRARALPVRFVGHLRDATEVAALQADADVVLAPGPVETFGLAALEALAAGTPVVADQRSALSEVLGDAGIAAAPTAVAFSDAVQALLARPVVERRTAARARALGYSWDATVETFLTAHGGARSRADR